MRFSMASSRSCASFFPKQTFYIMVASAARRPTELQQHQHQRFTNGLLLTLLYCSSTTTTTMYVWLCLTLALYSLTRDASAIEYRPDTGVVPTIQLFNLEVQQQLQLYYQLVSVYTIYTILQLQLQYTLMCVAQKKKLQGSQAIILQQYGIEGLYRVRFVQSRPTNPKMSIMNYQEKQFSVRSCKKMRPFFRMGA